MEEIKKGGRSECFKAKNVLLLRYRKMKEEKKKSNDGDTHKRKFLFLPAKRFSLLRCTKACTFIGRGHTRDDV